MANVPQTKQRVWLVRAEFPVQVWAMPPGGGEPEYLCECKYRTQAVRIAMEHNTAIGEDEHNRRIFFNKVKV